MLRINKDNYYLPNPATLRKKSFLNFPNVPNKPALVFIAEKNNWKECITVKQEDKTCISVMLKDGTIYRVSKMRKDFVIPLLDYYDMVKVCKRCRFRRLTCWNRINKCRPTADDMVRCFYSRISQIDYIQGECENRQPLLWIQKYIDKKIGKPTNKDILNWKKWDKYI